MTPVETSEDWLLVARLLRGKVDERPEAEELAVFAEQEAARLDAAQAEERFAEEVARAISDFPDEDWPYLDRSIREEFRGNADRAIAHLRPIAEWLIAEERWSSKPRSASRPYSLDAVSEFIAVSDGKPYIWPDEGPWDRWQDVPDGVKYRSKSHPPVYNWWWVNRDGVRMSADDGGEWPSSDPDVSVVSVPPFSRVEEA